MDALTSTDTPDKQSALARRYGAAVPPAGPWNETIPYRREPWKP
jgi:hypothetical protein